MVRVKLLLFIQLLCTDTNAFYQKKHRIMTPNNGVIGIPPPPQGNNIDIIDPSILFPQKSADVVVPTNSNPVNAGEMTVAPVAPTINVVPLDKIASPVVTPGPTIIRVEFPSAINIFVNITNCGQAINPTVGVTNNIGGTVEMPAVDPTIDTTTVDSTSEEPGVSTVETSTAETSNADESTGNTVEVEVSTVEATTEISTTISESTVEASTTESPAEDTSTVDNNTVTSPSNDSVEIPTTTEVLTTDNGIETSTIEIVVEIPSENSIDIESSSTTANTNEPSTEPVRQIQININLSDNTLSGNFGSTSTTPPPVENLGQLKDKIIYKEKCDEYFSRTKEAKSDKVQVFIVGGTSSSPKEFPHMAALGYGNGPNKEWLCGGSLISENYVVTAAHCLSSKNLGEVQVVRLGTTILNAITPDSEDYNVIKRIPHPSYNNIEQYNDIALLQLDHPVTLSEYMSPICLYSSDPSNEVLIATGWGKTEPTGDVSPELQKVELEYFSNNECQSSYSVVSKEDLPRGISAETQICAGSRTEVKDTCQGDSGGPLQIETNARAYLVGITSFGIGCGKPGRPGVYTRVSYYIPWIEKNVWGSGR